MGLMPHPDSTKATPERLQRLGFGCMICGVNDTSLDLRKIVLREAGNRYVNAYRPTCLSCYTELIECCSQDTSLRALQKKAEETCSHQCRWCDYCFDKSFLCQFCSTCKYCCICTDLRIRNAAKGDRKQFLSANDDCVFCQKTRSEREYSEENARLNAIKRYIGIYNILGQALKEEKQTGYVNVTGGRIWYETIKTGDKLPLVVVPGGPGNPHGYLKLLQFLAIDRSIIFYDPLGCGNSTSPNPMKPTEKVRDKSLWTMPRLLEELEALFDALGIKQAHFFGHSFGSLLATEFALKHPEKVASLIFEGACFSVPNWVTDTKKYQDTLPQEAQEQLNKYRMFQLIKSVNGETVSSYKLVSPSSYGEAISKAYMDTICRINPWPVEMMEALDKMNEQAYETMWGMNSFIVTGNLAEYDISNRLGEINCPTLLTYGRYDIVREETIEYYKSLIKNSKLVTFEQSSHVPHIEERVEYLEVLSEFLSTLG